MPGVDRSKVGGVFRVESGDEVAVAAVTVCSVVGCGVGRGYGVGCEAGCRVGNETG